MKPVIEVCVIVNQLEVRILFDGNPTLEHVADAINDIFIAKANEMMCTRLCGLLSTLGDSDLVLEEDAEAYFEEGGNRIGQLIVQERRLFKV